MPEGGMLPLLAGYWSSGSGDGQNHKCYLGQEHMANIAVTNRRWVLVAASF